MKTIRVGLVAPLLIGLAVPAAAQSTDPDPAVSIKPFVTLAQQKFGAENTFEAVFEKSSYPMWGGGADVVFRSFFVELSASRFKKTGQRAFHLDGETFRLGIPLRAMLTPFEVIGGYRFRRWHPLIPYAGAGFGTYHYTEESDFDDPGEGIDDRGSGFVAMGGVEVRAHRWVGVSVDVRYSRVTGIIGEGGLSGDFGDDDLGGVAARFKIALGR